MSVKAGIVANTNPIRARFRPCAATGLTLMFLWFDIDTMRAHFVVLNTFKYCLSLFPVRLIIFDPLTHVLDNDLSKEGSFYIAVLRNN